MTPDSSITTTTTTTSVSPAVTSAIVGAMLVFWIFFIVIVIISIVTMWKVYKKAGKPGWAAIIPIYNMIVLLEIVERPLWWVLLYFIPFVNLVVTIIVSLDVAKKFGKSVVFAIFGLILTPIGWLMLAFGKAQYQGQTATEPASAPPAPPAAPVSPEPPTTPVPPEAPAAPVA